MNGTTLKIVGFVMSTVITIAGLIKSYADDKQNEAKTREICNEVFDERTAKVQEAEFEEIEEENV